MQKIQLADRLGNVQTKKIGFSWIHFFLGPIYSFLNFKIFLGLFECLIIFYFCPIPGMDFLVEYLKKIPFIPADILNGIGDVLLLFRPFSITNYLMYFGFLFVFIIHVFISSKVRAKVLKRHMKHKELRPVDEKDARILIKWGVCDDSIGLAESFDIRETTKYKSAEENWYENNQIRIKSRPSFSTRSNIRYTVEQKAQIQSEQLDNLYKLGLINKEEYHSKKNALINSKDYDKKTTSI